MRGCGDSLCEGGGREGGAESMDREYFAVALIDYRYENLLIKISELKKKIEPKLSLSLSSPNRALIIAASFEMHECDPERNVAPDFSSENRNEGEDEEARSFFLRVPLYLRSIGKEGGGRRWRGGEKKNATIACIMGKKVRRH